MVKEEIYQEKEKSVQKKMMMIMNKISGNTPLTSILEVFSSNLI